MANTTSHVAASAVKGIMKDKDKPKRKAGDKLADFKDYMSEFDRTADGAGSGKGTDRFSGKDIRTMFDNRGDVGKAKAAQMVLDYALDSATEGSKMGGASKDAFDKLRGYIKEGKRNKKDKRNQPVQDPDPVVDDIDDEIEIDTPTEPTPIYNVGDTTFSSAPIQTITSSGLGGINTNQDNDISNMIFGNDNNVYNDQNNAIGDGLYAQRNPMDFKTMFMKNLFS